MDAINPVEEAIKARKSVRAYLNKPVARDTLHRILDAARFSPSAVNCHPWKVAVLTGSAKIRLQEKMEKAFQRGDKWYDK